ncbi:MAG: extracellular solute-binding protein [Deltaproteobacteria bacterium]|nr:extracellular solute-binding protein [Deltaproteobacteria bacterium]NIS77655.1 extracellular solute-binding protein [Deltaproteobacteria bacterium]
MVGKKIPSALLAFALALPLFYGCAGGKRGKLTIAFGGAPKEIEFWVKIIDDFEKKTGIGVQLLRQPTDTDQRRQGLLVPLKSRKADPDVFLMDVAWISQFAGSNWLEPLDDIAGQIGAGVFFERVLALADTYGGSVLALPVYVDGGLLYYRKDLLAKYGYEGPPETWRELVAMATEIQAGQRRKNRAFYGFVWQGAQYEGLICNFLEFSASNGGGIILKDGTIRLNTPENVTALELMRDLIHGRAISPPNTFTEMKEEEVRSFFQMGNAAFQRNWPYAWAIHQEKGSFVRGRVGIAPLPHFESGSSVSTLGGWHIGISTFSDAKQEARRLVQYILSYETQKNLVSGLGWNSGRRDIYEDEEILAKFPHYRELRGVLERALPRPTVPYYSQLSAVIQRHLNAAIAGKMEPRKALVEAERESRMVIERYAGK